MVARSARRPLSQLRPLWQLRSSTSLSGVFAINLFYSSLAERQYKIKYWRYVIFPYVTIPNVTSPKLVIIPNIYTNPKIPKGLLPFPLT
jgi:hypothetical protein